MIAAAVALILAVFLIPVIKQRNMQKRFEEQMDLGNRYLLEQDYEAAIVAFRKAIEIDPRQAESYRKMAEAYVGIGDYENAILTLEKGYEYTGEESLKEYQEEVLQMKERQERREAVIRGLYEACLVSDEDRLYEILYSDEYRQIGNEWELPLFYPEENGTALGIYQKGVYFGTLADGEMSVSSTYHTGADQWQDHYHFRANYGVYEIIAEEGGEYVISYDNGMVSVDEPGLRNVGVRGAMKDF